MRQAIVPVLVAALLLGGGGFALFAWLESREEEAVAAARSERERRSERAEEARERRWDELGRLSEVFVPGLLEGVRLGITSAELRRARPSAMPPMRTSSNDPHWEEALPNGAQVVYVFDRGSDRLARMQVLSQVPAEGVGPHLQAMRDRYGDPRLVLRCSERSAARVPTLRFVWGDDRIALQDILLVHPNGVSVTLYVAPADTLAESFTAGGCMPVRSREELEQLGVATPEMLEPHVVP